MASDATPVVLSVTPLVQGSQSQAVAKDQTSSGKSLPGGGIYPAAAAGGAAAASSPPQAAKPAPATAERSASIAAGSSATTRAAAASPAQTSSPAQAHDAQALVAQLNKYLNTTGRPDQYRLDPQSASTIQEVNPANGEVIAEFPADEFPALARSIGAPGLLIDSLA